jgi:hypothetical protein
VFAKLLSLRDVWNVEIPCTDHIDEYMGHQATPNCIVEAQVLLVLFPLLLHVTHHAFYEDFLLEEFCLQMLSVISLYY